MLPSALPPIAGFTTTVRHGQNDHIPAVDFKKDGVRKVAEQASLRPLIIHLPFDRVIGETLDAIEDLIPECRSRCWIAFLVPAECCFCLCLCVRQDEDVEPAHKASSLALASAHGAARMLPSRRPALRLRISARQASETAGSSRPSMLSSKATTNAERSSVGSRRASSSRWSTRAFIGKV